MQTPHRGPSVTVRGVDHGRSALPRSVVAGSLFDVGTPLEILQGCSSIAAMVTLGASRRAIDRCPPSFRVNQNLVVKVNVFGLGINSNDARPFLHADFHMPSKWTSTDHGVQPGPRAVTGMTFALFGDGLILATATFCGSSWREHRWEHRPSEDGRRHDYGPGWVLDLDPNTWAETLIRCESSGQSYRYGHLSNAGTFTQITAG